MTLSEVKRVIESRSRVPKGKADWCEEETPGYLWRNSIGLLSLTEEDGVVLLSYHKAGGSKAFVSPSKEQVEEVIDLYLGETKC